MEADGTGGDAKTKGRRNHRLYGSLRIHNGVWRVDAEPHVMGTVRRVFAKAPRAGLIEIMDSPAVCVQLRWFMLLYPLAMSEDDREYIETIADSHVGQLEEIEDVIVGDHEPRQYELAKPPRVYQRVAADVVCARRGLLLGDPVGLGKTVTAICMMVKAETQPIVVVCLPSLKNQWEQEIWDFAPKLNVHKITSSMVHPLPKYENGNGPDVVIVGYTMLSDWANTLKKYAKSIVFDEVQELRRIDTKKYEAASEVASRMQYRLGLSATPTFNYGGEMFNVMDVLQPGCLGTRAEFLREWCTNDGAKQIVRHPDALGAFLRREQLFLRRERSEVGRELPPTIRVTHKIDSDAAAFDSTLKSKDASELARIIMNSTAYDGAGSNGTSFNALGQMDMLLRQATGIAKAPYVAAFVQMLLDSGEKVVLYGWHRAVYAIWLQKLAEYHPAMFTGSESPTTKEREKKRFIDGKTDLMIISCRSAVGLNGLQDVCKTCVFGELDWSPAVMDQAIGRLARDKGNESEPEPVTAIFLVSDRGLDPEMSEILGVKRGQMQGIIDGKKLEVEERAAVRASDVIRRFAKKVLGR